MAFPTRAQYAPETYPPRSRSGPWSLTEANEVIAMDDDEHDRTSTFVGDGSHFGEQRVHDERIRTQC